MPKTTRKEDPTESIYSRIPVSKKNQLRELGIRNFSEFVRGAIIEKLERIEQQQTDLDQLAIELTEECDRIEESNATLSESEKFVVYQK